MKQSLMTDTFYRRNLPHIHPEASALFITFRLANSLPLEILRQLDMERAEELRLATSGSQIFVPEIEQKRFRSYDDWLERCETGTPWLKDQNIASIVSNRIFELTTRYKLIAFCIMPNHVHLLVVHFSTEKAKHSGQSATYPVTETLRLLKGSTARYCNHALGRTGPFWHHESYDHFIRSDEELKRTIQYVLDNPVKAGLVKEWRDWKYSYVNPEFGEW
jgi:putative transposase